MQFFPIIYKLIMLCKKHLNVLLFFEKIQEILQNLFNKLINQ